MLQYKELLEICVEALNSFRVEDQSVEEYIKDFLKRRKVEIFLIVRYSFLLLGLNYIIAIHGKYILYY